MNIISTKLLVQTIAFSHNGHIPQRYTCEGDNINPPIEISDIPPETKSLAIIMEDPDAPGGVFDHWLLWNLSPHETIFEKSTQGISGLNSFGNTGYGGPCPPSGTHRYYFRIYALDIILPLEAGAAKKELQEAMQGHVLTIGEVMGRYRKRNSQRTRKLL